MDASTLATQLNRTEASCEAALARAKRKLAAVPASVVQRVASRIPFELAVSPAKQTARVLSSIDVQRRFGGFLAVLIFTDGKQEQVGANVVQTPQAALKRAEEWIATPAYNIKWWTAV